MPGSCVYNNDAPCPSVCGPGKNEACIPLETQLLDLSVMTAEPYLFDEPAANYARPAERVESWRSENSGDIVLLAHMIQNGFYFDADPKASQHGSLTWADSIVPLAFAYPGATSKDNTKDTLLGLVRGYLQDIAPAEEPAMSPVEEAAMERVLGMTP